MDISLNSHKKTINKFFRDSYSSETDTISAPIASPLSRSGNHPHSQEHHYEALQVSHHLHTLLCIINQQMTTIASLQAQVNVYRDNPKTMYRHNDQLEELRNLQDRLQEEKTTWLKQKEMQEKELDERRHQQEALQKQIRAEQEDIKQQREQLYRKMEKLSNQGILLATNVALPSPVITSSADDLSHHHHHHSSGGPDEHHTDGCTSGGSSGTDKRKDKWRSTSSKS